MVWDDELRLPDVDMNPPSPVECEVVLGTVRERTIVVRRLEFFRNRTMVRYIILPGLTPEDDVDPFRHWYLSMSDAQGAKYKCVGGGINLTGGQHCWADRELQPGLTATSWIDLEAQLDGGPVKTRVDLASS